jgi:hypothetical protein
MPVQVRGVSNSLKRRTSSVFVDNSTSIAGHVLLGMGTESANLKKLYYICTEDFATNDVALTLTKYSAAGAATVILNAVGIVDADNNAPANIAAVDVGIDIPSWDLEAYSLAAGESLVLSHATGGATDGIGNFILEYEPEQDHPVQVN